MPALILYLFKLSVSLSVVYLFYQSVLRRLTFYAWSRFYLIGYTVLSFFIPLINITPVLEKNEMTDNRIVQFIPRVGAFNERADVHLYSTSHIPASLVRWDFIMLILLAGVIVMFLRLVVHLLSFKKIMNKAKLVSDNDVKLYQVNRSIIPFSFGNSIFINRQLHTDTELQEIIRHEFVHVRQKHTIDIIWTELLCVINWYNPFVWLIRKAIRQNLEFIADNKVLQTGLDKKQYQYLLLKVTGNNHFSIASQFNFSSLKKRIAMMNKMKSARAHLIKFLFVLPLIAVLLVAFRNNSDKLRQKEGLRQPVAVKEQATNALLTDTVPGQDKYIIEVIVNKKKGDTIVVVRDKKSKKEIKRMTLEEWDKNKKYYESLYGPVDGIVEDDNHPVLINTDNGRNVYVLKNIDGQTAKFKRLEITNDNKVKMTLDNGKEENYNLDNWTEKEEFENKYGKILPVTAPAKAGTSVGTTISAEPASPSKAFELTKLSVATDAGTTTSMPVATSSTLSSVSSVAQAAEPVKTIIAEDKIIAMFKKDMQEADVKKLEADLKEKGYDFKITKAEYNDGRLVLIKGHITKHNQKQYFNASNFSRLIISDSPDNNDDHFNFLVEQGRLSVNDSPDWQ